MDGAAALTGSHEAGKQRHLFAVLPGGQGLDWLSMMDVLGRLVGKGPDRRRIDAGEGLVGAAGNLLCQLVESVVAARL